MLATQYATSQYKQISIERTDIPELNIVQIDQHETSTLIYFTYHNLSNESFNGSEEMYLEGTNNHKIYKLLNSYNLPLDERRHIFGSGAETLNYVLEFEKIDLGQAFDLYRNSTGQANLIHVQVDTTLKGEFGDLDHFISQTPSREYYIYYSEGFPVLRYAYKGIVIAIKLTTDNSFGNYYQPTILIQNYTNKDILFDPSLIEGQWATNGKYYKSPIISHKFYISKVRKSQRNSDWWASFSESLAAVSAGFSSINSTSNVYSTAQGRSSGYGYIGYTPVGATRNVSIAASSQANTRTTVFNGSTAYAASQQARSNINEFRAQQIQQLNSLNSGYAKLNTIPPSTEYGAYFNMPYEKKADRILIKITLNKQSYLFEWDEKLLSQSNDFYLP